MVMKKILRFMAALAATTVAFSCMEEANPEAETGNSGGTHYEGPMTTLTFSLDEIKSKTSLDGKKVVWEKGDQIKIVYGIEDDAFTVAEVIDGTVTATVGDVDTYYAVYPETTKYTLTEVETEGSTTLQFAVTIPDGQDGSFKQANIMAAKTSKEDLFFAFKNLTHIFKFYRSEDSEFNGFRFLTNSSQDILLRGTYPVTLNDDGTVEMGEPTGQSRYIACVGLKGAGPFYIGFGPGVNMDYGFAVLGTRSGKNSDWEEAALTTNKVVTERSKITNLNIELDKVLHYDWYIKEKATGNGDGTSWDNAGDINTLIKLVGNEIADGVAYNGNTNCLRLNNARIYIAEGEYDIPTAVGADYLAWGDKWGYDKKAPVHKTTILGGYPATATGKDITTRDVDAYPTKLVNPYQKQNNRVLHFNEVTIPDLTFDGITFTKSSTGGTVDTGRGRIMLATKAKGKITFSNCRFSDLNTSNNMGGAAINIRQASSSEFIMNFNECKFTNNSCTNAYAYGGVIMIESDTKNATVNINGCTFTSNTTAVTKTDNKSRGGAIFAAAGVMNISGTTFESNTSQHYGGAIYADRTAEINISGNCTFKSNTASDCGGAIYVSGSSTKVSVTASAFTSNKGTNYGGAIYMNSSSCINASRCTFTSNTSKYGGAIANEISSLIVDECTFTQNSVGMQGGAICTYDADLAKPYAEISSGIKAYTYVYNSTFDANKSSNQGAAIKGQGSGYIAVVNSSFTNNVCSNAGGVLRLRNGSGEGVKLWYINNTSNNPKASDKTQYSISNQSSTSYCYNSIILNETVPGGTVVKEFYGSVVGTILYNTDGTKSSTVVTFADQIGTFADGVFPVKSESAAATSGMSSTDLAALGAEGSALMTAMPLFETKYLTVDQKGKSREGKHVMGAYVGQ